MTILENSVGTSLIRETALTPDNLTLDKVGPRFGAEVIGLDAASASDAEVLAIRDALVEHKVLVLRGQSLDDAGQIDFGRRLGDLTAGHPVHDSGHVAAEVYALDSQDNGFADVWHTDVTFMERPPMGSILRPVVLPPHGGDTNWADSQLAYESCRRPFVR